jgi:NitT/TauT family transport system permease protein
MKRLLFAVLFFVFLLLIWQKLFDAKIWSPVLLPAPAQVLNYLKEAVKDGTLGHAIVTTLRRLLIGYFVGIIFGLPLGLLTARWKLFHDTIGTMALGLVKPKPRCCSLS